MRKNPKKCSKGNTGLLSPDIKETDYVEDKIITEAKTKGSRLFAVTYYPIDKELWKEGDRPMLPPFRTGMQWLFYGREICPQTGKLHYQSVVYMDKPKSLKSIAKLFYNAHVSICVESAQHNKDYCRKGSQSKAEWLQFDITGPNFGKDAEVTEHGEMPQQGERTDIKNMCNKLGNFETTINEIIESNPSFYHQYGRTLEKRSAIAMMKRFRMDMTEGIWLWGDTGTGKTHKALNELYENFRKTGIKNWYVWPNDGGWWDGYNQEEIVIINDFRGEIPYNQMLQMIDKWEYSVKRRNLPPMPFMSKTVIITSSLPPEKIYKNRMEEDNIGQLLRRLKVEELQVNQKWFG